MNAPTRIDTTRTIRAPRGGELSCKSWLTEAPFRMLQNNLDPEVAENPAELVVYGGIGRAARNWECFDAILRSLRELGDEETLLIQSGKPVGVFPTHRDAPRVLLANSNLVPHWATWEHFNELDNKGLMMYGQMTSRQAWAAWVARSRSPRAWPAHAASTSNASRIASTCACARATSTSRPPISTTRSRASPSTRRPVRRSRSPCSATPPRYCPSWCAVACGPTR
jgi:hypothetical protein